MKCSEINIRDPFVVVKDGKYYMYGTRVKHFDYETEGFDVYVSEDMENWSDPIECFNSEAYGMDRGVHWAPEVHEYKGAYYMFATFTRECGLRATFILRSDSLLGPFVPHSKGGVTPADWECLDGTLYVAPNGEPYIVFCHEHTQIIDGTICYMRLREDLTEAEGEPITLFAASASKWAYKFEEDGHCITDGPFMYRSNTGELLMLWSSFINRKYAVLSVKFADGTLGMDLEHQTPLITDDGGHGMIFRSPDGKLYFTFHSPNGNKLERPCFVELEDLGDRLEVKK